MTPEEVNYAHCLSVKFLGATNTKPSRFKVDFRGTHDKRISKIVSTEAVPQFAGHDRKGLAHWAANVFLDYLNGLYVTKNEPLILLSVSIGSINADTDAVMVKTGYPKEAN